MYDNLIFVSCPTEIEESQIIRKPKKDHSPMRSDL